MMGYPRTLLLFYRRHLRVQPLRELMAIAGVAAGVALLFAVQVAHRSVTGSFEEIEHGVAGRATLELSSRGADGFSQRISEEVGQMHDVKALAPVLTQPIVAIGPTGRRALTLVGSTLQIASLQGRLSLEFQRAGESAHRGFLVLTEPTARSIGTKPGMEIAIQIRGQTKHMVVGAVVPSNKIGAVAESPVAAAPLPNVQVLAGLQSRITRLLIEPRAGRETPLRGTLVERYGSTINVRPVTTESKLLANAAGPERQITLLFSAISLVAGVILAYNALLLASEERRRFIVYLIETGTPNWLIVASLVFDALILGLAGSLIGLLAGDLISLFAYHSVPGYIAAAFAIGGQRVINTGTVLIALSGGMAAAFAAAVLPATIALRGGAAAEPDAAGRTLMFARRLRFSDTIVFTCGILIICLSVVISALKPATTVVALVGLAVGLMICLPLILRWLLTAAHTFSRRSSDPAVRLTVAELRSSFARSVALFATGAIAAFLVTLIGGSVADVQHGVRKGAADLLSSADIWIKPGGPENVYTTQPFAYTETQRRLTHLSAVSSVLPWRNSFLDLPGRRVWVIGVPPQDPAQIAPSQFIEGSLSAADKHLREGGWVAISQTIAQEDHLRIGQRFIIPTPTGYASLRLAAIVANYGWLSGAIVMNGEDLAKLWNSHAATQLAVTLKPGIPIEQGRLAIDSALVASSALTVQTASERRAEVSSVLGSTLSRLSNTTIVVLIATIASVIALTIAAISQRRGRLESLMSIGMSFSQFVRLIFYETGSVLIAGCLIGITAGTIGQYLIDGALRQATGAAVRFSPAWQLGLRTALVMTGVSVAASLIVALGAARPQPRAAFSTE